MSSSFERKVSFVRPNFALVTVLIFSTALYWWVGKVYVSQPRFNHPQLFYNSILATVLVYLPYFGFLAIVVSGFILTEYGWWYLGATVAAFIAFAVKPAG